MERKGYKTAVTIGLLMAAIAVPYVKASCSDAIDNCNAYAKSTCQEYAAWAKENCAKTCKYCGGTPEDTPHCTFNDKIHADGAVWFEGCKAKCGCHLNLGKFPIKCHALCWDYDIPSSCTWNSPKPGRCCRTPNCPSGVKVNYPDGFSYWGEDIDIKLKP